MLTQSAVDGVDKRPRSWVSGGALTWRKASQAGVVFEPEVPAMSIESIIPIVVIVLIVLFVLGYFGRGRMGR